MRNIVRSTLFITLIGFFASQAGAQGYVGVRGGGSIGQLFLDANGLAQTFQIEQDFYAGYVAGVSYQWFPHKVLGFRGDVVLANRGWIELVGDPELNPETYETSLTYAELNPYAVLRVGGRFKIFLMAGPYASFILGTNDNFQEVQDQEAIRYRFDADDDNRLHFGIRGGGGISLETGIGKFEADVQFVQQLSSLFETQNTAQALFSQIQAFEFGLTYYIRYRDIDTFTSP